MVLSRQSHETSAIMYYRMLFYIRNVTADYVLDHVFQVNLSARFPTINMNYFITSEEWNVDSTYTVDQRRYPFGPDGPPFSEVEFNLCLGRKPMFYVISIVLPSTLLSFLGNREHSML